jgi:hypothetical protein
MKMPCQIPKDVKRAAICNKNANGKTFYLAEKSQDNGTR